jgi:hypothetical protein
VKDGCVGDEYIDIYMRDMYGGVNFNLFHTHTCKTNQQNGVTVQNADMGRAYHSIVVILP